MANILELYPSNWLYNASVIGFLKVIAFKEGDEYVEKNVIQDNGAVKIDFEKFFTQKTSLSKNKENNDKQIPKSIEYLSEYIIKDEYIEGRLGKKKKKKDKDKKEDEQKLRKFLQGLKEFLEKLGFKDLTSKIDTIKPEKIENEEIEKLVKELDNQEKLALKFFLTGNKLFSKNGPCQNLVSIKSEWRNFEFSQLISNILNKPKTNLECGLCKKRIEKIDENSQFEKRLTFFQLAHFPVLGPSKDEFPNSVWNTIGSLRICLFCAYLLIHNHLAFIPLNDKSEIFINAPSFKVMWYLNKYFGEILSKNKAYQVKKLLGISFIELARKVYSTLGVWSISNIEAILKKGNTIQHYSLPLEISIILLNKEIADLIHHSNNEYVLEIILNGNFDELVSLNQKILKSIFSNNYSDKYLENKNIKTKEDFQKLAEILPVLYSKIFLTLKSKG